MLISFEIQDELVERFKKDYEAKVMIPFVDTNDVAESLSNLSANAIIAAVLSSVEEPISAVQTSAYHTDIRLKEDNE